MPRQSDVPTGVQVAPLDKVHPVHHGGDDGVRAGQTRGLEGVADVLVTQPHCNKKAEILNDIHDEMNVV